MTEATWSTPVAFADVWQRSVAARPDQTFLVFEGPDGSVAEWTYAEFDAAVARVAHTLRRHGVEPGDAVHLALTNSPSFVAVWLAAARLGAWIVPSDPIARERELAGHIERTRPKVGVCSTARADVYRAASGDLDVIAVDESDVDL
ncbi:MAG TPA: AMP-binding protein, partial [Acidimicrobiales bacterium]